MTTLPPATLRSAIATATRLASAVDVNKDGDIDGDEIKRIKVKDGFVTQNLFEMASYRATYPHDYLMSKGMFKDQLQMAVRSLQKTNPSKLAKLLVQFAELHAGKSVSEFKVKPYEKPGSPEWVELCKADYADPKSHSKPRFGTALILKREQLPSKVRAHYDAFVKKHPGSQIEASSSSINGGTVYQMHAYDAKSGSAQLVWSTGRVVARAEMKERAPNNWLVSWRA